MQEVICGGRSLPGAASPVHLHDVAAFGRNADEIRSVAARHGVPLQVFFARKANKAIEYVRQAERLGLGVDTASDVELSQTLAVGLPAERVIITAAVKQRPLMELAVREGCVVAIDNLDELRLLAQVTTELGRGRRSRAMLRVSGFEHDGHKLPSRFGVDIDQAAGFVSTCWPEEVELVGAHFHLDGYDAAQRVSAIRQTVPLIGHLKAEGHPVAFLDIGGGFPMSYLDDPAQWLAFRQVVDEGHAGITWDGTPYRTAAGRWSTYPYWQSPTRGDWFDGLLGEVAPLLRESGLELRCEPGRSLLDGCGMTVAEVVYRKRLTIVGQPGDWAIGLAMNRTQCRTTSEDFLVDPLLLVGESGDHPGQDRTGPIDGYLAGAYCMESEFLTKRRLRFPQGVAVGDRIAFPNTAGYLMHFLESRSHQFPLAENFVWDDGEWMSDPIDAGL